MVVKIPGDIANEPIVKKLLRQLDVAEEKVQASWQAVCTSSSLLTEDHLKAESIKKKLFDLVDRHEKRKARKKGGAQ